MAEDSPLYWGVLGQPPIPSIGVVIGIGGAAAASQILQGVLFGVSPFDPIVFIGAPLFLLGVAAAASLLPTRAALTVDPMTTLRYEWRSPPCASSSPRIEPRRQAELT